MLSQNRKLQSDSEVYPEMQRVKNSQSNIEEEKR
jgi:hypothetical protein